MKKALLVILIIALDVGHVAQSAANNTTGFVLIDRLIFFSENDPYQPAWSGHVRLVFSSAVTWATSTSCDPTSVAIRPADKNLIAAAQTALAMGRSVQLFIDDTQSQNGICFLRALQY